MFNHPLTTFSKTNRRLIAMLIASHLFWSGLVFALWLTGSAIAATTVWWSPLFIGLQLFLAVQLFLPALLLHPEQRTRSFYLFWGAILVFGIWLINQLTLPGYWLSLLGVIKSGLLLLVATLIGTALARYVNRLWEIIPICLVMSLADFYSWYAGPTEEFAEQIRQYYLAPEGPPPAIDMILVKLALPGTTGLVPVFGISDWIMVVFFAVVAGRHGINDNLFGKPGELVAQKRQFGRYLPVSLVALFLAILLAQTTGLFIPALPLIAAVMLLWYAGRYFLLRSDS